MLPDDGAGLAGDQLPDWMRGPVAPRMKPHSASLSCPPQSIPLPIPFLYSTPPAESHTLACPGLILEAWRTPFSWLRSPR